MSTFVRPPPACPACSAQACHTAARQWLALFINRGIGARVSNLNAVD
jgi:hypothetical protein